MKRVKVMLMSLVLLAVVGGALAFKAKFETNYCTFPTTTIGGQWTCAPLPANSFCADLIDYTTAPGALRTTFCYTTVEAGKACGLKKDCTIYQSFKTD